MGAVGRPLLLLMSVLAVCWSIHRSAPLSVLVAESLGFQLGGRAFALSLLHWVNDGLLTIFFLVVGLEIKREFTVGRLATPFAAALPVVAAFGGMTAPALIYLLVVPPGPLHAGWGMTIATDTAFAVALIVLLGTRVPVELRVFLTAAVIIDDSVAIVVIAFFYSHAAISTYLAPRRCRDRTVWRLNQFGVYRSLPYAVLGVVLWVCLHESGLHATLAGVILAIVTPTRPPANLRALMAQAEAVHPGRDAAGGEAVMQHGPSEPALQALDAIHDRIESPASKLLRSIEPWSSYIVLPLFALANAGVVCRSMCSKGTGADVGDHSGTGSWKAHRHLHRPPGSQFVSALP